MDDPRRRFETYFVPVCISLRKSKGASTAKVADLVGLGEPMIKRFEKGKHFPSKNLERYAAGYASIAGIDPREVMRLAIDYWEDLGEPPLDAEQTKALEESGPREVDPFSPEAVSNHISEAERQRGARHARSAGRPNATRKKKAGGG